MSEVRLKRLFKSVSGGSWGTEPEEGEVTLPCIRGTDFDYPALRSTIATAPVRGFSRHEVARRAARRGDLIIEKSGGGEKQPVGRIVLHDFDDLVMPTNFASRLTPSEANESRFLTYLMSSLYAGGTTKSSIKQTTGIQNLDVQSFLDTVVFRPSLPEQRAIVDYLDTETARIDGLIEKKRRLTAKLQERFRATIDHKLRELASSDILLKRYTAKIGSGKTPSGGAENYLTSGVIFMRSQNVGDGELLLSDIAHIRDDVDEDMSSTRIEAGDVLLNITGASIGRTAVVPTNLGRANVNQHVCIIRLNKGIDPKLIAFNLRSSRTQEFIHASQVGGNRDGLNFEQVGSIPIFLPQPSERAKVSKKLESAEADYQALRGLLSQQIELLTERRQALITAAVTGQLAIAGVPA